MLNAQCVKQATLTGYLHSLQLNVVMHIIHNLELSGLTFPENVK